MSFVTSHRYSAMRVGRRVSGLR